MGTHVDPFVSRRYLLRIRRPRQDGHLDDQVL
jgi:hypothetical protein